MGEEILESGEFWLLPEFFTGDGILADTNNNKPSSGVEIDFAAKLGSSSSYSLSSSAFSSPVESVFGSTDSDEDDALSVAELTRCFTEFGYRANQTAGASSWDLLSNADVATQEGKMLKMNGVDEGVYCHVGPQSGPTFGLNTSPLEINHCASFYAHQFPFCQVEPKNPNQVTNQNNGYILGRPSIELLHRQMQLQQQLISQYRSRVLTTNQFNYDVYPLLGLPYLSRPYPFGVHQMNKMSTEDSLDIFARKPTCAGTGVFIPRPQPPVAGSYIARNSPRFHSVKKTATLISAQHPNAPHHDTFVIGSSAILTPNLPGLQLDSLVKHEQCLPQEWSY